MEVVYIAGYFFIGFVLAVIWCYHEPYSDGMAGALFLAWPLVLLMFTVALLPVVVADFLRKRIGRDDK